MREKRHPAHLDGPTFENILPFNSAAEVEEWNHRAEQANSNCWGCLRPDGPDVQWFVFKWGVILAFSVGVGIGVFITRLIQLHGGG